MPMYYAILTGYGFTSNFKNCHFSGCQKVHLSWLKWIRWQMNLLCKIEAVVCFSWAVSCFFKPSQAAFEFFLQVFRMLKSCLK